MVEAIIKRVLDTVRSNRNVDLISVSGDYGARFICAVLAVDGVPIKVAASCAVTINAKRADGQSKAFEGSVNEDGTVKVPITQWMLEIAHTRTECTVSAVGIDTKLSATPFDIEVAETPHQSEEISPDDPDYDLLVRVLAGEASRNAAEAERVKAEEARALAEKERASAETERDQAETEREEAEALRATAETQREQAEASRNAAEAARVKAEEARASAFLAMDGRISRNEKRVATLEAAVYGDLAQEVEDNSVAYVKDVPPNALSAVKISKIGGMTYKDGDTLKSAPVTEVESVGKNLLPMGTQNSERGFTIVPQADGSYVLNGTRTGAGAVIRQIAFPTPLSIGTYTVTLNNPSTVESGYQNTVQIWFREINNGSYIGTCAAYKANNTTTFTTAKQIEIAAIRIGENIQSLTNFVIRPQLEKGEKATEFSPHVRHTLPIPEAVQALDGYGLGINDEVYNYVDWEKKQFVKRVGKQILNGSEAWVLWNNNMYTSKFDKLSSDMSPSISDGAFKSAMLNGASKFAVYPEGAYTVETWKQYLAENPMTVCYELATPEITDISALITLDNLISVEGGGTLTFENEYKYDVPSGVTFVTKEVSE